jgi:DnaJ-class molecular chaperone
MQNLPNHYKAIGVAPGATFATIREAYMVLARSNHPDTNQGDAEKFKAATEAYAILKSPILRSLYDKQRAMLLDPCPSCGGLGDVARYQRFKLVGYSKCKKCDGTGEKE